MITQSPLKTHVSAENPALESGKIYLLRHGETHLNALGVLQGSIEEPLNAKGRMQAQKAAATLAGCGIVRIVSSPQSRARQTAEIVAETLGLNIEEHPLLRERDWGEFEGKLRVERCEVGQGVEPIEALNHRAYQGFTDIINDPHYPCLIVTHSGWIKSLLSQACEKTPDTIYNGEVIQLVAR